MGKASKPALTGSEAAQFNVRISNVGLHSLTTECSACIDSFSYRTNHGDKLRNKTFAIEVRATSMLFSDKVIGEAVIDLHTIATGPSQHDCVFRNAEGKPEGHIIFKLEMENVSPDMVISLSRLKGKLPKSRSNAVENAFEPSVSIFYSTNANQKVESNPLGKTINQGDEFEWLDLPQLHCEATIKEIFRESLIINIVKNDGKSKKKLEAPPIAQAVLNLAEVFSITNPLTPKPFSIPLQLVNAASNEECMLSGQVSFIRAPKLAQLHGGVTIENDIIREPQEDNNISSFIGECESARSFFEGSELPDRLNGTPPPLFDISIFQNPSSFPTEAEVNMPAVENPQSTETVQQAKLRVSILKVMGGAVIGAGAGAAGEIAAKGMREDEIQKAISSLHNEHYEHLENLKLNFEDAKREQQERVAKRLEIRRKKLEQKRALEKQHEERKQQELLLNQESGNEQNIDGFDGSANTYTEKIHQAKSIDNTVYQNLSPPPSRIKISKSSVEVPLPSGWEKRFDAGGKTYFLYSNMKTGARQPTLMDPRLTPQGWDMRIDPAGKPYYANHQARATTYTDPRGLPDHWSMRIVAQTGQVFFANDQVKQTTFSDPRGMPPGWEMRLNEEGKEYFANHVAQTTQWDDPRKQQGVTHDMINLWKQYEMNRWFRKAEENEKKKMLENLERLQKGELLNFDIWLENQELALGRILSEQDKTQASLGPNHINKLRLQWREERDNIEIEYIKIQTDILEDD